MMTLRSFAESKSYCALGAGSPLVSAIYDASEGIRPTTIDDAASLTHFGCTLDDLPSEPRRTVGIRGAGRGGKSSRLLAVKSLHGAWTTPAQNVGRGEILSSLLVAPDMKLGRQVFSFVLGYIDGSKVLSRALIEPPTKDSVELRRPDGKRVRIEVLAASRGGRGVRGQSFVFAGLDEACFFYDEATGVVNDADLWRAVAHRVVSEGQTWISSTGWLEGVGLLEQFIGKNWGTHDHALVCTAGTRALNPSWDPDGSIERDLREQDPDAAIREIDGGALSGGAGTFIDAGAITACVDETIYLPVPARAGTRRHFGADLGFVADSSALVGAEQSSNKTISVVSIDEIRPRKGAPLKPKSVIDAFAKTIASGGGTGFTADGHYRESAREHLEPHSLRFTDAPSGNSGKEQVYLLARKLIHEGRVRIPNHPRLIAQLRSVVSRDVPGGGTKISIPRRRGAGHGDICSAFTLALWAASRVHTPTSGGSYPQSTRGTSQWAELGAYGGHRE